MSITGFMLTSLNVVNNAAVCWASTKRAAIVRRNMLNGLTSSLRCGAESEINDDGGLGLGGAAGFAAGGFAAGTGAPAPDFCFFKCANTSSFSKRPFGPDAATSSADNPFSSSNRCAAGITNSADPDAAVSFVAGAPDGASEVDPAGFSATRIDAT